MPKLIWWLTVFISCLVNSVKPFHMEEIGFLIDSYYTGDVGPEENPREIYQSFFATDDELAMACDPKPRFIQDLTGKAKTNFANYRIAAPSGSLVYPVAVPPQYSNGQDWKLYSPADKEICPIVAPTDGKIVTSIKGSYLCRTMNFKGVLSDGKVYTLRMINLECWFCDYNHGPYDGANYRHALVSDSDYGTIYAGQVIAYATPNTQIEITVDGTPVNFNDFMSTDGIICKLDDIGEEERRAAEEAAAAEEEDTSSNPA